MSVPINDEHQTGTPTLLLASCLSAIQPDSLSRLWMCSDPSEIRALRASCERSIYADPHVLPDSSRWTCAERWEILEATGLFVDSSKGTADHSLRTIAAMLYLGVGRPAPGQARSERMLAQLLEYSSVSSEVLHALVAFLYWLHPRIGDSELLDIGLCICHYRQLVFVLPTARSSIGLDSFGWTCLRAYGLRLSPIWSRMWSEGEAQLDTVFEMLRTCDSVFRSSGNAAMR